MDSKSFINILSKLLNLNIKNINFENSIKLQSIIEYEFWMHKATITLTNEKKITVFFKLIEKNKIKESIYCYWNLLLEQQEKKHNNEIHTKASIVELQKGNFNNTILLQLDINDTKRKTTQIQLIDISKYLMYNFDEVNYIEEKINDKILFIGS